MRIIAKIKEGESWLSAFIGWKTVTYSDETGKTTTGVKVSFNLGLFLVKTEFIKILR